MNRSATGNPSRRQQFLRAILEKRSASVYGLTTVLFCGLLGVTQVFPNELIVGLVTLIVIYEFQKRLDQGVPLLQLTALIATLQWLVGPIMNYNTPYEYGKYQMYVDEAAYFEYALPATCVYVVVMLAVGASVKQKTLLQQLDRKNFLVIATVLNIVSILAMFAAPRFSGGLQFALFLVTQFRYVGALYFLFSRHQLRFLLVAFSMAPLLISSLNTGMFHDLLLWMAILFCYWFAQRQWSIGMKFVALTASATVLFSIQAVKQEYRAQLRRGADPSLVRMMTDFLAPGGRAFEEDILTQVVIRLNQGWIISSILAHVPEFEPFAEGETIKDAVISALAPRFLFPDKKQAGGRENFRRFTGLDILEGTSMGISPLGEAYANFGPVGGVLLMAGFGAFFATAFSLTLKYVVHRPAFFFWLPLLFYQSIKAETEFLVVLNQLSKGAVVAFAMHWFIDMNFPVRLRKLLPQSELSVSIRIRRGSRLTAGS
jgi:hypothetical protein